MKRKINLLMCSLLLASGLSAQTYVNEMIQADIERDCYIEGGSAAYNDNGTPQYNDPSYVQKGSADTPTAFIFNREIWGNKNLTGFRINMLVPNDGKIKEDLIKIEYSVDEENYLEIPDMKVEETYNAITGNGYWLDIYYQAALPANVKEIKVTLIADPNTPVNWIPCYRRTEIFYEGGTAYTYMTPPDLIKNFESFNLDFESDNYVLELGGQNTTSSAEVVENPFKTGINTSNNVLKIVQDPTDTEWGWGNADWFGVAMSIKDGEGNQITKITDKGRYLNFMVYRAQNSIFGIENWGGSATYKNQELPFIGKEDWQVVTIDLEEYIGKTFEKWYFSPNEKFGTDKISVAETTLIDNISISETSSVNDIYVNNDDATIIGGKGVITIIGVEKSQVNVYTFTGVLVNSSTINSDAVSIEMSAGLYIVKAGNKVSKVRVY